MNPAALLALLGELYEAGATARAEADELRRQLDEANARVTALEAVTGNGHGERRAALLDTPQTPAT